jgi:hypothetical protein
MPFSPTDLAQKIRDMIAHVAPLPPEARAPWTHYDRTSTDLWTLLLYIERNFKRLPLQSTALRTHMARLHGMILVNLIESFERYLKEVAAACVDCLAQYVLDDRFNAFRVLGSALAAHFGTETLGRSLCESATWLDCEEINETAQASNRRIGTRLAELLSTIHAGNSALFLPQEMADRVTRTFGFVLTVAGVPGMLPP